MNREIITTFIDNGNTLLGIGSISTNITNAAIDIANETDIPIMLIASRRQIDSKYIQRGYVNNWSTEEFASYVRNRQKKDNIILARDHGGPWQNNIEITNKLSLKDAMKSAKESYLQDIEAGFDILHIDPSIDIYEQLSFDKIFERLVELYEFCSQEALAQKKNIEFEIGTEEQMIHINSLLDFKSMLYRVKSHCEISGLKTPLFIVSQIGTKVMETKNIGLLNQADKNLLNEIKMLCSAAKENRFYVKVHNTDYLNPQILKDFPEMKINAANVAPEFGVCETNNFLKLLEENYLISLENEFLDLAYNSKKWEKWVILGSDITNRNKAILAGHYVFSDERFIKIKEEAQKHIKTVNIDEYLKSKVKDCIMNYINCFTINAANRREEICQK